jgi:large subunit ribosomal protein L16
MQISPSRSKYKKQRKGKAFNRINKQITFNRLILGSLGLQAQESGRMTSKQMESIQQTINKIIKKSGKIIMNTFPQTPITKKPLEIRMGKGKGAVDHWIFKIQPGFVICEVETTTLDLGIKALNLAQLRLPFKTKLIFN